MKILQWNVQWCRGMDGVVDPARIARAARELADPDVICLQEVAINYATLAGSSGEDQVALLHREFPDYAVAFGVAVDVPDGRGGRRGFGNLILSRFPMHQVFRHTLPWPGESEKPSMPRIAVEATIAAPFGPLRVLSTHLEYHSARHRTAQIERLRELHAEACAHAAAKPSRQHESALFQQLPRPTATILAGDFNMKFSDPECTRLRAPFADKTPRFLDAWKQVHSREEHPPTFCLHTKDRAKKPYCCDFVFVSEDLAPRLKSVRVDGKTQASDHQPVIVELG